MVRNGLGSDRSSLYRRVVRLVKKGLQHCSKVAKVWLLGKNMASAVDGWASLGLQPWCLSARLDRRASFPVEASNSRLPTFARAVEGDRFAQPAVQPTKVICIGGSNVSLGQPSSKEHESLMNFGKGHTVPAMLSARLSSDRRSCVHSQSAGRQLLLLLRHRLAA